MIEAPWPFPLPEPHPETAPFWEGCRSRELRVQRCGNCQRWRWYPRPMCPWCQSLAVEWQPVAGRGRIASYVVVHRATGGVPASAVPYYPILVELDQAPGVRLPSLLVDYTPPPDDPNAVPIGAPVQVHFQPVSAELSLPLFRLADSETRSGPK